MKDVVYYEPLKPNQIVTADRYQQQLIDLNQKRSIAERKLKIILHDNARSYVIKVVIDMLSALQRESYTSRIHQTVILQIIISIDVIPC